MIVALKIFFYIDLLLYKKMILVAYIVDLSSLYEGGTHDNFSKYKFFNSTYFSISLSFVRKEIECKC